MGLEQVQVQLSTLLQQVALGAGQAVVPVAARAVSLVDLQHDVRARAGLVVPVEGPLSLFAQLRLQEAEGEALRQAEPEVRKEPLCFLR